jgi:Protein of unknown function (DUF3592)
MNNMSLNVRHIINILCVPVVLYGISFCCRGVETVKIANETYSWKIGTGTITYAGKTQSSSTGKYKASYGNPIVKYTYVANERNYQGDTVYWRNTIGSYQFSRSYVDNILSKYEKNKQFVVYYNPINPQESVLETGASEETFVSLVYGGILIFIGVVIPLIFFVFRGSSAESIKFK